MTISPFDRILAVPALTFDDVMLVPALSNLTPIDVSLATKFSQNIALHIPFASMASGDSPVKLAITLAQMGGIGILDCNMSVSEQATRVSKVKKFQARVVRDVITVTTETSIIEVLEIQQRYDVSAIPVVDAETRRLAGLVTADKLQVVTDFEQPVSNIMSIDHLPTLPETQIESAKDHMLKNKLDFVIIVDAAQHCVGIISKADLEKLDTYPQSTVDQHGRLRVAATICAGHDHYDRIDALMDAGVDAIYVDAPHGHSKSVLDTVTHIRRQRTGHVDVIAGRVVMPDAASALIDAGANSIVAGIDFDTCGVGMPNLTGIMHVTDAASIHNIPVLVYDIQQSDNAAKAIAAGASALLFRDVSQEPNDVFQSLQDALRKAMCVTGSASMTEFHLRARFIKKQI